MNWWTNRFWYAPIAFVVLAGYAVGVYGWFMVTYQNAMTALVNPEARELVGLFFLGIVGGAMHCAIFLASDFNDKIYGTDELPTFLCAIGYTLQIVGGGITGVFLFLAFKAGLVVMLTGGSEHDLNKYAAWLLALAGGYGTHHVKRFIGRLVQGVVKKEDGSNPPAAVLQNAQQENSADSQARS